MILLFEFEDYYPNGGWGDHVGTFATVDEARTYMDRDVRSRNVQGHRPSTRAQIVNISTGSFVGRWEREIRTTGDSDENYWRVGDWVVEE